MGTNALGIFAKNTNGTLKINAPIVLSDSGTGANAGTTIGIYSDGDAQVKFGQNSTLGLLNGATGTVNVGTYLQNNTINISSFGSGASIFFTTGGITANLDQNYTVTNGTAASTAVLVDQRVLL